MAPVGGLRVRLVFDSVYNMLNTALTDIGWFAGGRAHQPVTFRGEPVDDSNEVPLNTLVLTGEDMFNFDIELGSQRGEFRRQYYLDFYAESHALGEHMAFDMRDVLQGRMASIGRTGPVCQVYDYSEAGDPALTVVEFENVIVDRAPASSEEWRKHWWSVAFDVIDTYANESG